MAKRVNDVELKRLKRDPAPRPAARAQAAPHHLD